MRRCGLSILFSALAIGVGVGAPMSVSATGTGVALVIRQSVEGAVEGDVGEGVEGGSEGAVEGGVQDLVEGGTGPSQVHPEAADAIGQLYSPYCPGYMLGICTAPASAILRDSIDAYANAGWSSEELVEWMIANHGEEYRAVPLQRGWGIWAWIFPPAGLLLGVFLIVAFLRRRVRNQPSSNRTPAAFPSPAAVSTAEEARLRSAIHEIELDEDPSF